MSGSTRFRSLRHSLDRLGRGARNALDLVVGEGLTGPESTPFEVHHGEEIFQLRHYGLAGAERPTPPVLLVPPLMVYSEVYDISPELSSISELLSQGLDVWLVDFGAPEHQKGGMRRSLDDHVEAIDRAVDLVVDATGQSIHLIGYSQGGLFCYQAAAYRRSRALASIITFGAPVDIYRNLPLKVHDGLSGRVLQAVGEVVKGPLKRPLEAIPGISATLSSTTFKVLYPGNEVKHLARLVGVLPNRRALERELPKRRFLGGEGFVAWPGPAFLDFLEQVVVENRLASGGLVIQGRAVSLADITCPILYFFGSHDNLARPSSVKSIERVSPHAEAQGVEVESGHFGLVVGAKAIRETWPVVVDWVRWRSEGGGRPQSLEAVEKPARQEVRQRSTEIAEEIWLQLGEQSLLVADAIDSLRWQLPRLAKLENLRDGSPVSMGRALATQARSIPRETFFLWGGRAFTYAEANLRVDQAAAVLDRIGVKPGARVGILADIHPDLLTYVVAVSRLGAVSVLPDPQSRGESLSKQLDEGRAELLVVDVANLDEGRRAFIGKPVAVTGLSQIDERGDEAEIIDLDHLLEHELPGVSTGVKANQGRARDIAMIFFVSPDDELPKAVRITNRRWAIAALGAAARCRLTPSDTVLCCLPLHQGLGMLATVGGALVGGARLALEPSFSADSFWDEVRRTGATVVASQNIHLRALIEAPRESREDQHPVRLFLSSGLEPSVWEAFLERFGPVQIVGTDDLMRRDRAQDGHS